MKYYILKNASNANGWDMFPAGEAINYTLDSESLSVPHEIEIGSMVIGYRSAPKDRFYSLFKVVNVSDKTLLFEKELEVNGGISISEVRPEIRELMESDYSGIFEIEKPDYESICNSMFVYASTDFVGKPFIGTNEKKNISSRIAVPRTARRFLIKRLNTCRPGESTLTRLTSPRSTVPSLCADVCVDFRALSILFRLYDDISALLSQFSRTRGSTTAYRRSEIRLPRSVRLEMKAR
jgi:hypothetical protein